MKCWQTDVSNSHASGHEVRKDKDNYSNVHLSGDTKYIHLYQYMYITLYNQYGV